MLIKNKHTNNDNTEKKNIIVTSLFKMKSGGYKNFQKYLNGIKIINEIADIVNMELRIFVDNTILKNNEIMNFLSKLKNVVLIKFKCKEFYINKHHLGLFGTLIRFMPLFDFPNNDSNVVIVVDSDFSSTNFIIIIDLINNIKKIKPSKRFK